MAGEKVSALAEEENPTSSANVYIINDIEGTPTSRRSSIANFISKAAATIPTIWTAVQTFSAGIVTSWIAPASNSTTAVQFRMADQVTPVATIDTVNSRLHVGSAALDAGFSVYTASATGMWLACNSGAGTQIIVSGRTDENKRLYFGYNTTGNYGSIQAIHDGVGISPLVFQHYGGRVGVGITSPTAIVDISASTAANASLRLRDGVAPTTPNNGDIWQDGTNLLIRIGGTTYTLDKTAA